MLYAFTALPWVGVLLAIFPWTVTWADSPYEDRKTLERTLKEVIEWQILWKRIPPEFKVLHDETCSLALTVKGRRLAYCSADLGICQSFLLEETRNWLTLRSAPARDGSSDEVSLRLFLERISGDVVAAGTVDFGLGTSTGFKGEWRPATQTHWTMNARIGQRPQIVKSYRRQAHKGEVRQLHQWLARTLKEADYRTITYGCFKSTDPTVEVFGSRRSAPDIIFSLFWDRQVRGWVEAGNMIRDPAPRRFDDHRKTIDELRCGTIQFQ